MASISERIKAVKQPRGGYVNLDSFTHTFLEEDGEEFGEENVHSSILTPVVLRLAWFMTHRVSAADAFSVSLRGASIADAAHVLKDASGVAQWLAAGITGLDEQSIVNACKLVTFDIFFRNLNVAMRSKSYMEVKPDAATIHNIAALVSRCICFTSDFGVPCASEFNFFPVAGDSEERSEMMETGYGSWGGYTPIVSSGDGDFLTPDTMWLFRLTNSKPTSKHTMKLLMQWVMGQHSGQQIFKDVRNIGIFNPRVNDVYRLSVDDVPSEIIQMIERDVICYPD